MVDDLDLRADQERADIYLDPTDGAPDQGVLIGVHNHAALGIDREVAREDCPREVVLGPYKEIDIDVRGLEVGRGHSPEVEEEGRFLETDIVEVERDRIHEEEIEDRGHEAVQEGPYRGDVRGDRYQEADDLGVMNVDQAAKVAMDMLNPEGIVCVETFEYCPETAIEIW